MPGPLPKDPSLLQRRNKGPTRAKLPTEQSARRRKVPNLPERLDGDGNVREWNALTLAAWRDWWKSPMAAEWLKADVHGLFVLAELLDDFWHHPSVVVAAEIRQQRQAFGLTPIDRRRLQWEVEKVETAIRRPRQINTPAPEPIQSIDDPRAALRIV